MNRAILVKSCQRFRERREACEATWAKSIRDTDEYGHIPIWPIIGDEKMTRPTEDGLLVKGDDGYGNNSIKLRDAMKWLLGLDNGVTHWFVCDDDTFVHPQRWLAHEPQGELECRVFHPVKEADKKRNGGQPWVSGGSGWWMSRRLCELYVAECNERTSADDILVARIAAKHGIEMVDRPDLYGSDRYSGKEERVAADNELITCHHVQPAEMVELWEATRGLD